MEAPQNAPFSMPMFRDFVPRRIRPWIYLLIAVTFQMSGGLYMGTLNQMTGETSLMREDLTMCLYANLAGMAVWFSLLFRMKFRFTNRTLLSVSAAVALLLLFMLYDMPVRRRLKLMPVWRGVRDEVARSLRKISFRS